MLLTTIKDNVTNIHRHNFLDIHESDTFLYKFSEIQQTCLELCSMSTTDDKDHTDSVCAFSPQGKTCLVLVKLVIASLPSVNTDVTLWVSFSRDFSENWPDRVKNTKCFANINSWMQAFHLINLCPHVGKILQNKDKSQTPGSFTFTWKCNIWSKMKITNDPWVIYINLSLFESCLWEDLINRWSKSCIIVSFCA